MSLVCNVCQRQGKYRVVIDMGRFTHRFYYCEEHKPVNFQLELMDEKQHDEGEIIMQDKFASSTNSELINKIKNIIIDWHGLANPNWDDRKGKGYTSMDEAILDLLRRIDRIQEVKE